VSIVQEVPIQISNILLNLTLYALLSFYVSLSKKLPQANVELGWSVQGYEPTSMRAIRARYDPYEQSKGRVEQLRSLGHSVDKVNTHPFSPSHPINYSS